MTSNQSPPAPGRVPWTGTDSPSFPVAQMGMPHLCTLSRLPFKAHVWSGWRDLVGPVCMGAAGTRHLAALAPGGCRAKWPPTEGFKQQKFTLSRFWGLKSETRVSGVPRSLLRFWGRPSPSRLLGAPGGSWPALAGGLIPAGLPPSSQAVSLGVSHLPLQGTERLPLDGGPSYQWGDLFLRF